MSDSDGAPPPEPSGLDGLPPIYSIAKGEVVSVQTYGAFVRLPGYKKEGLVHVSEMSASRVENAADIVDVGEQVWIKVIGREMKGDKVKLSFSMKAVNQGTGRDQDPNNVMAEQDERRRRNFRDHTGRRITLEAVLNTTCAKCGCKGHFTKDCFAAGGLQYALVPEEDDQVPQQQQQQQQKQQQQPPPPQTSTVAPQQDTDTHKKKKKKKEKKLKKKRKRSRKESESDSSSGSSSDGASKAKRGRHDHTEGKEDRKKKKHKKHNKSRKHS